MRFNTLQQWLTWQESLNPKEIDLGLDRVQQVLQRLHLSADFNCPVITVAGTNGKGSSVALLEAMLRAAGYRVGCYSSPHLFAYNERIRIDAANIDDQHLCQAFEQVDQARGDVPLTYFEFGTLAALRVFAAAELDVMVLEVGLGGRLDAVNVIDADVALITTVDLDHTDWLGADVETIAGEKAGIMRAGRPVIYAGLSCPQTIQDMAAAQQASLLRAGVDYLYQAVAEDRWQLHAGELHLADLQRPALAGAFQLQNAAGAIMALSQLDSISLNQQAINAGLVSARLAGRYQCIRQQPRVLVDVAHNVQAAEALLELLRQEPVAGRTLAVIGMLADKAIDQVVATLAPAIDEWFTAGLDSARGLGADLMAKAVNKLGTDVKLCPQQTVAQACAQALDRARDGDRIIVFGSFLTVTAACDYFRV